MNSIQYNYFNPEQIILLEKRVFNNVIKFPCSYAHKASFRSGLIFETPYMYSPFGLGKYLNNQNNSKYYIDLSFYDQDMDIKLKQFYNIIDKIDKYVLYYIRTNIKELELEGILPKINISEHYTKSIRYNINKKTKQIDKSYPPTIKIKLFTNTLKVFSDQGKEINMFEYLKKGSYVKSYIKCNGIWILNGKFGLTWTAKELYVKNPYINMTTNNPSYSSSI